MSLEKSIKADRVEKLNQQAAVQRDIRLWISRVLPDRKEECLDESIDIQTLLKDGQILCELANHHVPGAVRISKRKMAAMQRDNIANYLQTCRRLDMRETSLFQTVDLYEGKDMLKVIDNLNSFKTLCTRSKGKHLRMLSESKPVKKANMAVPFQVRITPKKSLNTGPQIKSAPAPAAVTSLEDDVQMKEELKFNPELEKAALRWIGAYLEAEFNSSLAEELHDGTLLCELANRIKANTVPKIYRGSVAYKQMENIEHYLKACTNFGLAETDLFNTSDLYNEKNINVVINHVHVLAKHLEKFPGYDGPSIESVKSANMFVSSMMPINFNNIKEDRELGEDELHMIEWANSQLAKHDPPITIVNLSTDTRSGIKLAALLKTLCNSPITGSMEQNPTMLWHAIQNAKVLLAFLSAQTFETYDLCKAQDIANGNVDKVIQLLAYARDKFDLDYAFTSLIAGHNSDASGKCTEEEEKALIQKSLEDTQRWNENEQQNVEAFLEALLETDDELSDEFEGYERVESDPDSTTLTPEPDTEIEPKQEPIAKPDQPDKPAETEVISEPVVDKEPIEKQPEEKPTIETPEPEQVAVKEPDVEDKVEQPKPDDATTETQEPPAKEPVSEKVGDKPAEAEKTIDVPVDGDKTIISVKPDDEKTVVDGDDKPVDGDKVADTSTVEPKDSVQEHTNDVVSKEPATDSKEPIKSGQSDDSDTSTEQTDTPIVKEPQDQKTDNEVQDPTSAEEKIDKVDQKPVDKPVIQEPKKKRGKKKGHKEKDKKLKSSKKKRIKHTKSKGNVTADTPLDNKGHKEHKEKKRLKKSNKKDGKKGESKKKHRKTPKNSAVDIPRGDPSAKHHRGDGKKGESKKKHRKTPKNSSVDIPKGDPAVVSEPKKEEPIPESKPVPEVVEPKKEEQAEKLEEPGAGTKSPNASQDENGTSIPHSVSSPSLEELAKASEDVKLEKPANLDRARSMEEALKVRSNLKTRVTKKSKAERPLLSSIFNRPASPVVVKKAIPEPVTETRVRSETTHQLAALTIQRRVIDELLSTERSYITSLNHVVTHLVKPIKQAGFMTKDECESAFLNIEQILKDHKWFLRKIAQYIGSTKRVAEVFLEQTRFLQHYETYLSSYHTAVVYSHGLQKKYLPFEERVTKFETDLLQSTMLTLNSFIVMPVQRLPRYVLLLKQLKKYTKDDLDTQEVVEKAITYMEDKLTELNRNIDPTAGRNAEKVLSISESMYGGVNILVMGRTYIRDGLLSIKKVDVVKTQQVNISPIESSHHAMSLAKRIASKKQNQYAFLFDDCLVFATSEKQSDPNDKPFTFLTQVDLKDVKGVVQEKDKKKLSLVFSKEVWRMTCNQKERDMWFCDIRNSVANCGGLTKQASAMGLV